MVDGSTEAVDHDITEANRQLVSEFVNRDLDKLDQDISAENFSQHSPRLPELDFGADEPKVEPLPKNNKGYVTRLVWHKPDSPPTSPHLLRLVCSALKTLPHLECR